MTDAARLHQTTFMAGYRMIMVVVVLAGVVLAIALDSSFGLTVAIFGALMLATTWMQFLDRLLYRNRGRGLVGSTIQYVVDDRGIHYESQFGSGVLLWSALTHVRANDKSIAFGRDRVMAAYVPTSAFASIAQRDSFLAFARARVGGSSAQP